MVQLTQDCFAFGKKLIKLENAINRIHKNIKCNQNIEKIHIKYSLDRTIATNVVSKLNVPPYSNSAVDGYAIRYKDYLSNAKTYNIAGKSTAGHPCNKKLKKLDAIRIFTGAILPNGFDTIIMEEDCVVNGKKVILPSKVKKNINYRCLGEDIKINSKVFSSGHKIRPQDIGVLSSLGISYIKAFEPITVSIFSCGDELINIGTKLKKGQIYDSNRVMITNFLKKLGCKVNDLGILKDNKNSLIKKLNNAANKSDLIITSGGMSLGDEDHIKAIIETIGKIHVWRLAIKPGRPVGFGTINNTPILGLPGNPAAAFVTFLILAIPIIKKMSGEIVKNIKKIKVPINFNHKKKTGRKEFLRVQLIKKNDDLYLNKFPKEGAGILSSASWASGLGIIDDDIINIKPNDKINYISLNELLN